jgi:hypothetical protein
MDNSFLISRLRELALDGATASMFARVIVSHKGDQIPDTDFLDLLIEAFDLEPHSGNSLLLKWRDGHVEGPGQAMRPAFCYLA